MITVALQNTLYFFYQYLSRFWRNDG